MRLAYAVALYSLQQSPLRDYIPVGSIVTKLDDTLLFTSAKSDDPWVSYLSRRPIHLGDDVDFGWCVAKDWVSGEPDVRRLY